MNHPDILSNTNEILEEKKDLTIGFEGPEKRLQIDFCFKNKASSNSKGFRSLNKDEWQSKVLDHAKCRVISLTQNKHFDAYLLSESSLFVYPTRVMLKTCGTTTLLHAVSPLLALANEFGMNVRRVMYSRKNFNFPHVQPAPHSCFDDEVQHLDKYFQGKGVTLGPCEEDHWNFYLADYPENATNESTAAEQLAAMPIVEVMMHDLNENKMKQFFKQEKTSAEVTKESGISDILPGSLIDGFCFDPCGYSMNGLLNNSYSTIHITPESHCSYVSYETNCDASLAKKSQQEYYPWVIQNVLRTFRPARFMVAIYGTDAVSLSAQLVVSQLKNKYHLNNMSMFDMEGGCQVVACTFTSMAKPVNFKKNPGLLSVLGMDKLNTFDDKIMDGGIVHDSVMQDLMNSIAL